jgi:N,N'-diacetyllegionaminate synthase
MAALAASDVVVLQCTSAYPCPPERVNLTAMATLAERFGRPVGLSDHTADIFTSIAAVTLGAVAVEKHFTLSHRLYGPDHHASLEPEQLARLVAGIREVEAARGTGAKEHDPGLDPVRATFEKSVVAAVDVPADTVLDAGMLTTKRPGTGFPAARLHEVLGRRVVRPLQRDDLLAEADLA